MYSRRLKVEERENKRKATGFVLLTFAAFAFLFFYGLPLLAKVSNFAYDLKKSGESIESSDKTPPPPPRIDDLPEFTNNENLEVKGHTEPGATVILTLNAQNVDLVSNNDGEFSHTFSLLDGENNIYAVAKDTSGNQSQKSENVNVTLDSKPPEINELSPKDGEEFYGSRQKQITISGKTEKEARVQINERLVIVDSTGAFSATVSLSDGENKFSVKAQDQAGNTTETIFNLKYYP